MIGAPGATNESSGPTFREYLMQCPPTPAAPTPVAEEDEAEAAETPAQGNNESSPALIKLDEIDD